MTCILNLLSLIVECKLCLLWKGGRPMEIRWRGEGVLFGQGPPKHSTSKPGADAKPELGACHQSSWSPPTPAKVSGSELCSPVRGLSPVWDLGPSHLLPQAGEALPGIPALRTDDLCVLASEGTEIGLNVLKGVGDSRKEWQHELGELFKDWLILCIGKTKGSEEKKQVSLLPLALKLYVLSLSLSLYRSIYLYVCVCVCVYINDSLQNTLLFIFFLQSNAFQAYYLPWDLLMSLIPLCSISSSVKWVIIRLLTSWGCGEK